MTRAAYIADINARTLLSTAEAEGRGADTIQKIADTNKSLIHAYDDQGSLLAHNVTQQELLDGMQGDSPKYSSTAMLGPIDGYRLLVTARSKPPTRLSKTRTPRLLSPRHNTMTTPITTSKACSVV